MRRATMRGVRTRPLFAFAVAVASGALLMAGQQPAPAAPGPFTAEQAAAGGTAYQVNCAGCHGASLDGLPPLSGPAFTGSWNTRTTRDLFGLIRTTMPSDNPGGLPEQTYVNIVAYILQFNGRTPGNQPLTAATEVPIGGGAPAAAQAPAGRGGAAAGAAQAPGGRGGAGAPAAGAGVPGGRGGAGAQAGAAAGGGGRGQPQAPVIGLTVAGQVKNFARVTDEMLRNPPPGDWLMIRRDQFASSYSPLTQVTRDNA